MSEIQLDFKEELLLILFFSPNYQSKKTRLIKLLFLFEELFDLNIRKLEFIQYRFGPWLPYFETLITPMVVTNLLSYQEEEEKKIWSFSEENKNTIVEYIQNSYLEKEEYKEKIQLIQFLANKFKDEHSKELIQFVYFLFPNFTEKSEIKDYILSFPPNYNQSVILEFIEEVPFEYNIKLFSNPEILKNVLKLFNIPNDSINGLNFKFIIDLLQEINTPYMESSAFDKQRMLKALYEYPSNDLFKPFKMSLISIFSMPHFDFSQKTYKSLLLFIFQSMSLNWPLNTYEYTEFNKFILDLKERLDLGSFLDELPDANEKERMAINDIGSQIKMKSHVVMDSQKAQGYERLNTLFLSRNSEDILKEEEIEDILKEEEIDEKRDETEDKEFEKTLEDVISLQ